MRTIQLDGVSYPFPQNWAEVSPDQLPKLIRLVYLTPENGKMYHELLQALLGIKPKAWKKLHQKHFNPNLPEAVRKKNAVALHDLVFMSRWVWQQPMTEQPFKTITVDKVEWLLPEPGFVSVSYGELTDLYVHLQAYITQQEAGEGELDYLVATACRPARPADQLSHPDWDGDHRERYNEFIVRERVRRLKKVPFEHKLSVLLFVASTIQAVLGKYTLFDANDKKNAGSAESYTGQGFIKNTHLLAEKGIFGNLKQTQQANAHEVLLFLEEHRADQIERQQAHEQH
ncbi:hypothetical protein [Spirosoma oryzicola]|uniref:hypothetical protein n=1 Tax=Spirosoma oryzicola TaxID=2898794 RepID=UPI001E5C42EA|nr:hypothetical protein [Spirosoma oryzicola]UHG93389.1 hypothetical protein LQ777_10900 [Spirosoma oryzicola]